MPTDAAIDEREFVADVRADIAGAHARTVSVLRESRRDASRRLRAAPGAAVLRIALELLEQPRACPRWFAYELVHHHKAAMGALSPAALNELATGLAAWHEVDPFGLYLLGIVVGRCARPLGRSAHVPWLLESRHRWQTLNDGCWCSGSPPWWPCSDRVCACPISAQRTTCVCQRCARRCRVERSNARAKRFNAGPRCSD